MKIQYIKSEPPTHIGGKIIGQIAAILCEEGYLWVEGPPCNTSHG